MVSDMAQKCYFFSEKSGKVKWADYCSRTHDHTLVDVIENRDMPGGNHNETVGNKDAALSDSRYIPSFKVEKFLIIAHYFVKSRQEFYKRACDSVWKDKYFECPRCTPETFFNLTESYANNFEDRRVASFSSRLRLRLKDSTFGDSCNTQPTNLHSLGYYQQQCFGYNMNIT